MIVRFCWLVFAGKTTLALAIKAALGKNIAYLSHDNYYKVSSILF